MTKGKKMWLCDGDKSPLFKILSKEPCPYNIFEDEMHPPIITVHSIDPDFDNGFHFDTVENLEIGCLFITEGMEVVRARSISTVDGEKFLLFDRGYGNTTVSEIRVGDKLMFIGWEEPKDLYPLMVTTLTKDGEQ